MPKYYNNRFKTVFFNRYPFPKRKPIDTDSSSAKTKATTRTTTSTTTSPTTTTTTTTTTMTTTSTSTTTPMTTSTELIMTAKTTKSVHRPKPKVPYLLRPFFIKLKNTPIKTPPTPIQVFKPYHKATTTTTTPKTTTTMTPSPTLIQKQPQEMLELFDARTKIYVTRPPPNQKRTITERPQKFGFKLLSTTIRTPVTTSAAKVSIRVYI